VVRIGDDHILFDCGPATTYKMVQADLHPRQINWLFFTHHHSDHNADYPCFLMTRWDQGGHGQETLKVFGPPPTSLLTERLMGEEGAFTQDWKARVEHPVSQFMHQNRGGKLPRPKPVFDVKDIEPGVVFESDSWKVTAESVHHVEPWLQSMAYRVDSEEGSIVLAGDAGPSDSLPKLIEGVDVLVMACAYDAKKKVHPLVADVNTGSLPIANYAKEAKAKVLIATHSSTTLSSPGTREKVVGDMAEVFKGRIIFADELMCLDLP
jgi:ribonuclease Z